MWLRCGAALCKSTGAWAHAAPQRAQPSATTQPMLQGMTMVAQKYERRNKRRIYTCATLQVLSAAWGEYCPAYALQ